MRGIFITSVGTGIGKTLVTSILGHQLMRAGRAVRAIKPVVTGFSFDDPASDPALILRSLKHAITPESIAATAPWRFAEPVSPHLAARREGRAIIFDDLVAFCHDQASANAGILLIEGAGGVMAPVGDAYTNLDLIARLGHPVVLVTGTYLGVLSHTLTALAVLRERRIMVQGIVVSESEHNVSLTDTVASIRQFARVNIPLYSLPRLSDTGEEKWLAAPCLTGLCDNPDAQDRNTITGQDPTHA